ncbi:MAG: hypothetical protein ACRDHN_03500, partial [Thermomicrobiales bacterium]
GYSSVSVTITLAQFETASAAKGFIQHSIDRVTDVAAAVRDLDGALELGDESAAIVVAFGQTYSVQYIVQIGAVAVLISWDNYVPSPLSLDDQVADAQARFAPVAHFTAQKQVECVEAGYCVGMVAIPAELMPQM